MICVHSVPFSHKFLRIDYVIQGYPSLRLVILDGMYISAPLTMVSRNVHHNVFALFCL